MATTISRSFQSLRFSRRYLHSLCRWAAAPREPPLHESSPLLPPVISHGRGLGGYCCGMYGRFLFSTTADAVNPGNPAKKIYISTNGAASASTLTSPDATTSGGEDKAGGSQQSSEDGGSQQSSEDGGSQQSSEAGKPVRGGPVSWLSFLLLVATGLGIILYYDKEKKRHIEDINSSSIAVKQGPSAGKAAIGGPFNLINDEGKDVTEKDFLGKWTVIYFGFTHCPDICPDELQKLASTIDKIKEKAGIEIVPVFISVDPERDTVQQVHEYVKEFQPKLIA
ncbi:hypothetical protein MLD38_038378 [Melastoma candidum]|uniref:Uncharacterized protein n=1 Tax=Melastoma candidum TaxID=119954 RepID=A0ACB9KZ08_9MYRT|nr:hypothetical protein MLD38_038378 [Melastoma candidum]